MASELVDGVSSIEIKSNNYEKLNNLHQLFTFQSELNGRLITRVELLADIHVLANILTAC